MRKVLCEWNQEEIDELATETCECVNARIYTHKKSQKERAHNKKRPIQAHTRHRREHERENEGFLQSGF